MKIIYSDGRVFVVISHWGFIEADAITEAIAYLDPRQVAEYRKERGCR